MAELDAGRRRSRMTQSGPCTGHRVVGRREASQSHSQSPRNRTKLHNEVLVAPGNRAPDTSNSALSKSDCRAFRGKPG
jgi:hypothetical protein